MLNPGGFFSAGTEREAGGIPVTVAAQRMLVDSFTKALVEPHVTILPVHLISGMWGPLQVQRDPKQSTPRSETDLQGHSDTHFQIWSQVLDTLIYTPSDITEMCLWRDHQFFQDNVKS